ncbi:hypothetical protein AAMO2058_000237600 [Amorphochlora amoebiformis]
MLKIVYFLFSAIVPEDNSNDDLEFGKIVLQGGKDDEEKEKEPCFPWCYTKGPCGCILMIFFMMIGLFCYVLGYMFKCFVCVVTCPCPGSSACNCCADTAAWMLNCPAKCGKCIAGSCPC